MLETDRLLCEATFEEAFAFFAGEMIGPAQKFAKNLWLASNGDDDDRNFAVNDAIIATMLQIRDGNIRSNPSAYLKECLRNNIHKTNSNYKKLGDFFRSEGEKVREFQKLLLLSDLLENQNNPLIFKVKEAFEALDPVCQERISMRKIHGYSHPEIMEELAFGETLDQSKNKLSDCIKKMKRKFNKLK